MVIDFTFDIFLLRYFDMIALQFYPSASRNFDAEDIFQALLLNCMFFKENRLLVNQTDDKVSCVMTLQYSRIMIEHIRTRKYVIGNAFENALFSS